MTHQEGRVAGGTNTEIQDPATPPAQTPFPNQEIAVFTAHFGTIWRELMARQTNAASQQDRDAAVAEMAALMNTINEISGQVKNELQSSTRIA